MKIYNPLLVLHNGIFESKYSAINPKLLEENQATYNKAWKAISKKIKIHFYNRLFKKKDSIL